MHCQRILLREKDWTHCDVLVTQAANSVMLNPSACYSFRLDHSIKIHAPGGSICCAGVEIWW